MISSTTNQHVKWLRLLRDSPRERRSTQTLLLEGVRLVSDALAGGAEVRLALFAPAQLETTSEGLALCTALRGHPGCFEATPAVVAAAADTRQPQGIIAACAWPYHPPRPGLRLVLDGIQDPGNLGTLLRSAEAAAVGLVICGSGCADPFSPKVLRAAMGAHFSLPLQAEADWEAVATLLAGCPQVYAAEAAASLAYDEADWTAPAGLIIGGEAQGVSPAGLRLASQRIAIPMPGRSESLNAAVAGSIILFEALRQCRQKRRDGRP